MADAQAKRSRRLRPAAEVLEARALLAFGTLTEHAIPTPASRPWDVAVAPDGTVWFTESAGNKVGRLDARGLVEFAVPTPNALPYGIAAADGRTYFVEYGTGKVGRITPSGAITEGAAPVAGARYADLALLS